MATSLLSRFRKRGSVIDVRETVGVWTPAEIRLAYRLFLGREAEDDMVVQQKVGLDPGDLVFHFVGSPEFHDKFVEPVTAGASPGWAASREPEVGAFLEKLGAQSEREHWSDLFGSIFTAPVPRAALERAIGPDGAETLVGRIDEEREARKRAVAALPATLDALRGRTTGLDLDHASDILWEPGRDVFRLTSADPWILARFGADGTGDALFGLVSLTLAIDDAPIAIKVYLDHGQGFSEAGSISGRIESGSTFRCVIADPMLLRRIRLDLGEHEGVATRLAIDARLVTAVEDVRRDIEGRGWEPGERSRRLRLLDIMTRAEDGRLSAAERSRKLTLVLADAPLEETIDYPTWLRLFVDPEPADYEVMKEIEAGFAIRPRFSFVLPTYNTPVVWLRTCIASLLAQTYAEFEVCIADDRSTDPRVADLLAEMAAADPRIRYVVRRRNGHISECSNTAAALATGDFIVLMDHDDELPDYALFVVAAYVNRHPDADIFYSDEDKIDEAGIRSAPYHKSDYNRFLMFGHNMVSHLGVYRTSLFREVQGFRRGFEGSQDYDLFLRCVEKAGRDAVVHIPHVLYHWRMITGSTAVSADQKSYAIVAAQASIGGHMERTGLPFCSKDGFAPGITSIKETVVPATTVSVIVPTRDGLDVLEPCIETVLATADEQVEIVVADNGSSEPDTLAFLDDLPERAHARIVRDPSPFNFSTLNNGAAAQASGEILCFLNNDTEVVSPRWLDRARALLSVPEVGAVGARLLFPDGTLQHFGIVLGMGAHGIAGTPHGGVPGESAGYFGKGRLAAEFSAVTAACLFVRRRDFEAVGGFDPELRVAYNDVDLCLKLRARGLKIVCDPEITLVHKESRTRGSDATGERAARLKAEEDTMKRRWGGVLRADPYYSPNLSLAYSDMRLACPPRVPLPWQSPERQLWMLTDS